MKEKVLNKGSNGFGMMILWIVLYLAAIPLLIIGVNTTPLLFIAALLWLCLGWIPFLGLKVLGPQEALVLTLFGNYVGTLKDAGFYWVNPFCVGVNPAASTQLGQSGDVQAKTGPLVISSSGSTEIKVTGKKISLKIMTLNNAKQKVNDVLGNPVEIGVAVMWRVVDTAAAVFTVDNYKEYLSLQSDAAVRNIVKLYPYDIAQNVDTTGDGQADDGSLRGSTETVARRIKEEIQSKVEA
ncbi:MAG: SPFH domain-containing protein, partial [Lachnospiraceae bacterium]|nr:SPFH domain-containing protein [Lachnospiraceae bacterium]